eukprot:CAMPEP_0172454292 /NCGR_PEP_ID=MMETSP1065-20121228/11327_1 /TAXON_ID=265537 /ORGANISM="Amphiprora paludosa, Strain CCMP125" /LENGTH=219 /DNA_ID=CAMNT_0013206599 /DNA_START=68 /DNA_END=723 /DNA_ORIENTATION=+
MTFLHTFLHPGATHRDVFYETLGRHPSLRQLVLRYIIPSRLDEVEMKLLFMSLAQMRSLQKVHVIFEDSSFREDVKGIEFVRRLVNSGAWASDILPVLRTNTSIQEIVSSYFHYSIQSDPIIELLLTSDDRHQVTDPDIIAALLESTRIMRRNQLLVKVKKYDNEVNDSEDQAHLATMPKLMECLADSEHVEVSALYWLIVSRSHELFPAASATKRKRA